MPMRTDHFDGEETERVLGVVLCPTSYGKSIYVRIPTLDTDRRTDGGAKDIGGAPDYAEDIEDYDRDDYVYLTFEPSKYGDKHVLTLVEQAQFTDPLGADEPKFPNTDTPKVCPSCGREAAALVKTEYDSTTGGKVSDTADACAIDPENRGAWFGFSGEMTFVHGVEN